VTAGVLSLWLQKGEDQVDAMMCQLAAVEVPVLRYSPDLLYPVPSSFCYQYIRE